MSSIDDYKGIESAWCPGCGNFPILKALKETLVEMGVASHEVMVVSGIGQAPKLPHYMRCNFFNGLHGRALPVATGIRLANNTMRTLVITGDGDCYGEGGNHFMHTIRRNVNLAHFVHNNQVYGLTKGQSSPTTAQGSPSKTQPYGTLSEALNPVALAVSLDASFVARAFAGDAAMLKGMMRAAMEHNGYAVVDILQPCVSFNKVNTYDWYKERVYHIGADHDPEDRVKAFALALEFGERIPTGIIYKNPSRPVMEESIAPIRETPLIRRPFDEALMKSVIEEFNGQ